MPPELGDWINAAQTFIRWAKRGVRERLLELAQQRAGGINLGMAFLDGTNIRAHAKVAGAAKKGGPAPAETAVKHLDGSRLRRTAVAAMAPRRSRPRMRTAGP